MEAIDLIKRYAIKLGDDILFYGTYEECRIYIYSFIQ